MQRKTLPKNAYTIRPGETFVPYTHGQSLREFTVKTVLAGALLGMLFGFANTYLGLTAGLTISTSIPVAVWTISESRRILFVTLNAYPGDSGHTPDS